MYRLITGLGPGGSEATDGSQEVGKQTVKTAAGDMIIDPDREGRPRLLDTLRFQTSEPNTGGNLQAVEEDWTMGEVSQNRISF